MFKGFMPEVSN
uniref:Uncharacterized protein n=1 Tax=Anguilla anguilla TaxID=7936 RepID=A0A0E9XTW3_ANGAN